MPGRRSSGVLAGPGPHPACRTPLRPLEPLAIPPHLPLIFFFQPLSFPPPLSSPFPFQMAEDAFQTLCSLLPGGPHPGPPQAFLVSQRTDWPSASSLSARGTPLSPGLPQLLRPPPPPRALQLPLCQPQSPATPFNKASPAMERPARRLDAWPRRKDPKHPGTVLRPQLDKHLEQTTAPTIQTRAAPELGRGQGSASPKDLWEGWHLPI